MGGIDTLVNHELIVRLPHRINARTEIGLHSMREAIYGVLFGGLALFAWHGAWATVIGALLAAEVFVDASDEFVENRTRVLPQNERVLHFFLTLNLGFITVVLVPILLRWGSQPTALVPIQRGVLSWVLAALAVGAMAWAVRDLLAWLGLRRRSLRVANERAG
ncbi:MAG: hypothetical protein V7642_5753 [Burkholderiales bacterium]|jgi:hypothetical protein